MGFKPFGQNLGCLSLARVSGSTGASLFRPPAERKAGGMQVAEKSDLARIITKAKARGRFFVCFFFWGGGCEGRGRTLYINIYIYIYIYIYFLGGAGKPGIRAPFFTNIFGGGEPPTRIDKRKQGILSLPSLLEDHLFVWRWLWELSRLGAPQKTQWKVQLGRDSLIPCWLKQKVPAKRTLTALRYDPQPFNLRKNSSPNYPTVFKLSERSRGTLSILSRHPFFYKTTQNPGETAGF